MTKLEKALELFDAYNKQDPRHVLWQGSTHPQEYFYAMRLYEWVLKLEPEPVEPLLLASRSQHIGRWKIPRKSYPEGKGGYFKWRTDLSQFHAETAGRLMQEAGYGTEAIESVQKIIRKEQLKTDPEVQVIENALCLVFLEFQFDDFIAKHTEDKTLRVIRKSWTKMTQPGRDAAMRLQYSERGKAYLSEALNNKTTN